jgi:Holliday junction resolvase RusA-like endonuclease
MAFAGIDPGQKGAIEIIIPGNPIAKKRPRFVRRGKFVAYNDQETEEGKVILHMKNHGIDLINTPVSIEMEFLFARPKSHYGTGRNANVLKRTAPEYHIKKPDVDNLIKFYLDCMNAIILKDDSIVYAVSGIKKYANVPGTVINIKKQ